MNIVSSKTDSQDMVSISPTIMLMSPPATETDEKIEPVPHFRAEVPVLKWNQGDRGQY